MRAGAETNQGIPTRNRDCTVMKYANMPTMVAAEAIMTMSHKFSWASGQWYFRLRSDTRRITVSVAIDCEGDVRGVWGELQCVS